ncbi:MAG: IS1182 family transposase [Phaeodactylibacter sp.]|nr:IS1182 family transposase [Phaeodactylibacter sp.]
MRKFITPDRNKEQLMPISIDKWLPEKHLARFVVEILEQMDLSAFYKEYKPSGPRPYDPRMLLGLLFYGYATGVFSSRKIEEATYDSVAFRFISGNLHPDHDTLADFRKRFLGQIGACFVQILLIAQSLGFVKVGQVNIDGTKVQANASKHSAMSYEHMERLEQQFKEEVERLMERAKQVDLQEDQELDIPAEIQRREDRLEKIRAAKAVIEQRAKERFEREQAEYEAKMKAREEKERQSGRKIGGKKPKAPEEGPTGKDQYNFTDPESRIMKTSDGFDQCYNAQAAVCGQMLIVGAFANAHCVDTQELLSVLDAIPPALGKVDTAAADNGYFSQGNVQGCASREVDAYIAVGKQTHNQWLDEQLAKQEPEPPGEHATPSMQMSHKLKTEIGRAIYRLRKMTVEPVFGIIKEIMGFRRFSLRGEVAINGEWLLVCSAFNLKRLFVLVNA